MKITSDALHAYLKCPTKCRLRATSELAPENTYSEWVKKQNYSYQITETQRLVTALPNNKVAFSPDMKNVDTAKWRLATSLVTNVETDSYVLESELHAVELAPAEVRRQTFQLIPIRFTFTNKLGKDDKLLLAFDAFVLSKSLGRDIVLGKIIHGDDHATLKVKTSALAGEVRKCIEKVAVLLASPTPPDLILNRHCVECEFKTRCHKEATQQDDLSLLAGMTGIERKRLNNKGTFTVKQLSFAFLPRRRPKKLRDRREKYHHSLKALAIREEKIHIAGRPALTIEGTPVFFDVEALPDRGFYYLVGLRIKNNDSAVQHSLWADGSEDEAKIYFRFLDILKAVEKPQLIHYGSFETDFLRQMAKRYGISLQDTLVDHNPINLLSIIYGQIYFPTYSNGLKSIATWLGFEWSDPSLAGIKSTASRCEWEASHSPSIKAALIDYNVEDCQATEVVANALHRLHCADPLTSTEEKSANAVYVETLKKPGVVWGPFTSQFKEFEQINQAAWWNYQRDRIKVRSNRPAKLANPKLRRTHLGPQTPLLINRTTIYPKLKFCPSCSGELKENSLRTRILYDLLFGKSSVKRWIVRCRFHYYQCACCHAKFGEPREFWPQSHLGRTLVAYVLYQTIELCVSFPTVREMLIRCYKLDIHIHTLMTVKKTAAKYYRSTYDTILHHLVTGSLLHVDETQVSIRGRTAYVWTFTNFHDVAYLYTDSREGAFLQEMLKDFKGVLISDFYAAYDSINCEQQKCLVHLMRDLNDSVLKHPYDEELKIVVREFAALLKVIVDTIDHRGLKARFLRKHQIDVDRFYRKIAQLDCQSEQAEKCSKRFEKNRDKLFTFLRHDSIPWHNNNAEHAIKAFSKLRDITRGSFTEKSVRNILILLSICQTCKYSDLDFFEFLRNGEKDIDAFARGVRGRRRSRSSSVPQPL